jgi:hypothetical protein
MVETPTDSFRQARWFTGANRTPMAIRLGVIHTMQVAEAPSTAEGVAVYFSGTGEKASAHVNFDENSSVRCVHDKDVAYGAPNVNHDGKHSEFAGYAEQSPEEWNDGPSIRMLERGAQHAAEDSLRYDWEVRRLSLAEVRGGVARGFCGHADASRAFNTPGGHMDPGGNFPWDWFLERVRYYRHDETQAIVKDDEMDRTCIPSWGTMTNGRMPFFRVDQAPDVGPTAVRVLAYPGAPLLAGLDQYGWEYGGIFGVPFVLVKNLAARVLGIEEKMPEGTIYLLAEDGGTFEIARRP